MSRANLNRVPNEGSTPVAPVIYPRFWPWPFAPVLEEGQERGLGLDGDDTLLVQPDASEDAANDLGDHRRAAPRHLPLDQASAPHHLLVNRAINTGC